MLLGARHLAAFCRYEGIDILDAHTSNAHSLALLVKKRLPSLKLVVHRRVDYLPKPNFLGRRKYLNPKIDRFVAISGAIAKILANFGIGKDKIRLVNSGVDASPYQNLDGAKLKASWRQRFNIAADTVVLGSAAALTEQKDFPTLLQALALLKEIQPNFHCFIAGDGFLRKGLEEMQQKLGLSQHVTFLGWVEPVAPFLCSLDVFVLSSEYEGLGTVIQEAVYAGCAIAATATGGIPEMIVHSKTGFLAPAKDPKDLALCLDKLILDPELRQSMAKEARIRVEKLFSLEQMVAGNLKVYAELVEADSTVRQA